MHRRVHLCSIALSQLIISVGISAPALTAHAQSSSATLELNTVLQSVNDTHPSLKAAELKQQAAEYKLTSSRGAFDLQLAAGAEAHPLGGSDKAYGVLDFTLTQPTTLWGLSLFAGWNASYGYIPAYKDQWYHKVDKNFTGYKGNPEAGPLGRVHGGIALPILRDGAIDKNRANVAKAKAKVSYAQASLNKKRLDLQLKASDAYWSWLAAGMQVKIATELLETAAVRQKQIEEKVKQGSDAPIYAVENQKYLLKRQKNLLKATQKLQESAIKLSIYWRPDERARPRVPGDAQLPTSWPSLPELPTLEDAQALSEQIARNRPEWQVFLAELEQANISQNLYQNQLLPRLDLTAAAAQPIDTSHKTDMRITLDIASPLQRREARGAQQAAQADVIRIQNEQRLFQDQILATTQQSIVTLQASAQAVDLAQQELELTRTLEEAERIKLQEGDSTLLVVNLREQATADAAMSLVDAQKKLHMSYIRYRLNLGTSLLNTP